MTIEQECLAILADDLGPVAKVFLLRVCKQQLRKEPAALQKSDVEKFAKCCYLGLHQAVGIPTAERVKKRLMEIK
jgi:hypothetical protein